MFNFFKAKAPTAEIAPSKTSGAMTKKASIKVYGSSEFSPTSEEIFSELQPPSGLRKFKNMEDNEPIIGGLLLRLQNIIKSAEWEVVGQNADIVSEQLNNIRYGISGLLGDLTSAFTFGFAICEKVWAAEEGKIVLKDVKPLYQLTIMQFVDAKGEEKADQTFAEQQTMQKGTVQIPLSKCIHFIPIPLARNPYGKSLLRSAYKPYYYKASIEASEAQGIDRSLSGLPVMTAPEGFDFVNADEASPGYDENVAATLDWAEKVVSKVRKDEMQGIVKPFGWLLELLKSNSTTTVNSPEIISRLNVEMAVALLQTFAINGGFASTNNSNIEEMVKDFQRNCDAWLSALAFLINREIVKDICDFNMKTDYPVLSFKKVAGENIADLAGFVARLMSQGLLSLQKALSNSFSRKSTPLTQQTIGKKNPKTKWKMITMMLPAKSQKLRNPLLLKNKLHKT